MLGGIGTGASSGNNIHEGIHGGIHEGIHGGTCESASGSRDVPSLYGQVSADHITTNNHLATPSVSPRAARGTAGASLMASMDALKLIGMLKREWVPSGVLHRAMPTLDARSKSLQPPQPHPRSPSTGMPSTTILTRTTKDDSETSGLTPASSSARPPNSVAVSVPLVPHGSSPRAARQLETCEKLVRFGLHQALFSDITVWIMGVAYTLHRVVLYANPFFKAKIDGLDSSALAHCQLEIRVLDVNVTSEAVQMVIQRLYGDFSDIVTLANLTSVLSTAHMFHDKDLYDQCCNFIDKMDYTNSRALSFLQFATTYNYGVATATLLRNVVLFFCREGTNGATGQDRKSKVKAFSRMDLDWCLRIVHSDAFFISNGGEFERFVFILDVLRARFAAKEVQGGFGDFLEAVSGVNTNVLSLGTLSLTSRRAGNIQRMSWQESPQIGHRGSFAISNADRSPSVKRLSLFVDPKIGIRQSPLPHSANGLSEESLSTSAESNGGTLKYVKPAGHNRGASDAYVRPQRSYSGDKRSSALKRHSMVARLDGEGVSTVGRMGKGTRRATFAEIDTILTTGGLGTGAQLFAGEEVKEEVHGEVAVSSATYVSQMQIRSRRKSALDPPTREEFLAKHAIFMSDTLDLDQAIAAGAEASPSISNATLVVEKTLYSGAPRDSAGEMMHLFQDPNASFRQRSLGDQEVQALGAAVKEVMEFEKRVIEASMDVLSRGIIYTHMTDNELLKVRSEKVLPAFVHDRHFRMRYDLQAKVGRASSNANASAKRGYSSSVCADFPFADEDDEGGSMDRQFRRWVLEGPLFPYDGLEVPPVRFSLEVAGVAVSKLIQRKKGGGDATVLSRGVWMGGSIWYLKVDRGDVPGSLQIVLCRKQGSHGPFTDPRPTVLSWCRVIGFVSGSGAVTDGYTMQRTQQVVALNGHVVIASSGSPVMKALTRELYPTFEKHPSRAMLRFSAVVGLM